MLKEDDLVGRVQKIIKNPDDKTNNDIFEKGSLDDILNSLK